MTPLDILGQAGYVSLTTFRRDGTPVATAVWVVRSGDELRVWTRPDSGKVKRIRRDGHAQIAPCTSRGKPLGNAVEATATLLSAPETEAVLCQLQAKYGLRARLAFLPGKIGTSFGRPPRPSIGISITLAEPFAE